MRKRATGWPGGVKRSSGSSPRFPQEVIWVSHADTVWVLPSGLARPAGPGLVFRSPIAKGGGSARRRNRHRGGPRRLIAQGRPEAVCAANAASLSAVAGCQLARNLAGVTGLLGL